MNLRTLFLLKDRFLLLIHKYYCKYVVIHTYLSHYILCLSFGSLLSAIVHLLPEINARKNMCTALFCVVCALPVFIIVLFVAVSILEMWKSNLNFLLETCNASYIHIQKYILGYILETIRCKCCYMVGTLVGAVSVQWRGVTLIWPLPCFDTLHTFSLSQMLVLLHLCINCTVLFWKTPHLFAVLPLLYLMVSSAVSPGCGIQAFLCYFWHNVWGIIVWYNSWFLPCAIQVIQDLCKIRKYKLWHIISTWSGNPWSDLLIKRPVRDAYLFSPKFDWSLPPAPDYGLPWITS